MRGSGTGKPQDVVNAYHVEESHKRFFGTNYPEDSKPRVLKNHFDHPYPIVQESDDYDKDFVKDENADNGEWKAQMEYDALKNGLAKEQDDVKKALETERKAAAIAKAAADLEAGLPVATKKLEEATRNMHECEAELQEARRRLKELQEEKAEVEKAMGYKDSSVKYEERGHAKSLEELKELEKAVEEKAAIHRSAQEAYETENAAFVEAQGEFRKEEKELKKHHGGGNLQGNLQEEADENKTLEIKIKEEPERRQKSGAAGDPHTTAVATVLISVALACW